MGKIKALGISLCSLIPVLINNFTNNSVNLKQTNYITASEKSDSIYLINRSHTELKFYYEDKYLDRHQFHLLPDSTFQFFSDDMQIVTQTNENQNFYLFYPGDTLYATVSSKGDAIFSVRNDSIRNNQLDLQWKINEATPLNFMKILQFRVKYFNTNYQKIDSIYKYDYTTKINFINRYIKSNPISQDYEIGIKDYYKAKLVASQLWLAANSKAKISASYFNYLDSIGTIVHNIEKNANRSFYNFFEYGYHRYQLKSLKNKNELLDSLYARAKLINNKKNKQLTLLKIVKEELSHKPPYKQFVKDFIENEADPAYAKYVKNLIYNNGIMSSVGNKSVLLNVANRKFSLDSLIHSLKGNVLYIDVWASWCNPCRAEMPRSAVLRKRFQGQKIKFIYLSIDDNISNWKKANEQVSLDQYDNSYLLLNAQETAFIKGFKIRSIPRYILINKNGVVSNANALRPSDNLITNTLEELIPK